jgi:hypothetical protein
MTRIGKPHNRLLYWSMNILYSQPSSLVLVGLVNGGLQRIVLSCPLVDTLTHLAVEIRRTIQQRIVSYSYRVGAGNRRLSHLLQLAVIDSSHHDSGKQQESVNTNQPSLPTSYIIQDILGWLTLLIGGALGLKSHYTLLYSGYRGGLRRRLVYGISGWACAGFLIWHGMGILLGE